MSHLISVIIPVYNVEKYLEKCIDSVINQTYQNLEIILIDDGSKDNSGRICDEYAKKDARIKVIHKENGGVSSARNVGLDNATGDYIAFVDSDDWIDSDMYEFMLKKMLQEKVDMVRCKLRRVIENDGKSIVDNRILNVELTDMNEERIKIICGVLDMSLLPAFSLMLVKREFVENLRFEPELIVGEDMLFVIELYTRINSIYWCKNAFYNYNIYDFSTSKSSAKNKEIIFNYLILYSKIKKVLIDNEIYTQQLQEYLDFYIFYNLYCRNAKYIVDTRDITVTKNLFEEGLYKEVIKNINKELLSRNGRFFLWASKNNKTKLYYIYAFCYEIRNRYYYKFLSLKDRFFKK